jgi:hypothetical protein
MGYDPSDLFDATYLEDASAIHHHLYQTTVGRTLLMSLLDSATPNRCSTQVGVVRRSVDDQPISR